MTSVSGLAASPGIGVGPIVRLSAGVVELPDIEAPHDAVMAAVPELAASLRGRADVAAEKGRDEAADVLRAQSFMAEDPMLTDAIGAHLDAGASLSDALDTASAELEAMLASLPDPYLAARAADVGEVAAGLRRVLAGEDPTESLEMAEPSVLVAATLTAAETADLDPQLVLGFVTETGGPTSHVAIIARALGVPAVVGAEGIVAASEMAAVVAIDGSTGDVVLDPDDHVREDMMRRAERQAEVAAWAASARGTRASFDGRTVVVSANVGRPEDIDAAIEARADGVGLFRTEFLFLDRSTPPTEDEQYEVYRKAAEGFDDAVVIRAFDIGGDKPAEFITVDDEENPFLGIRGVRLYDEVPELFETQVRACLRAAVHGPVNLMIPMVATTAELVAVRSTVARVRDALLAAGVEIGEVPIGAMVEVPSIALTAGAAAPHADFFSIGTNDLTQYTLAADRTHGQLGGLQDPLHPSVLSLCRATVLGAQQLGRSVSVCGLAAADPTAAAIFAAIGIDKLSVTPSAVDLIKATVSEQKPSLAAAVHRAIDTAADGAELRAMISDDVILR